LFHTDIGQRVFGQLVDNLERDGGDIGSDKRRIHDMQRAPDTGKDKEDSSLMLQHGEPMIFGKNKDRALVLDNLKPKVVNIADVDPEQILKHEAHDIDSILPGMLASLHTDVFPMPFGVLRQIELPVYDTDMGEQVKHVSSQLGAGDLQQLLMGNSTWTID